jgi:hypothetical protein
MDSSNSRSDVFTDINGLVAAFLDDIAGRPAPRGAEPTLAAIRRAVAAGTATTAMALAIIELFPREGQGRAPARIVDLWSNLVHEEILMRDRPGHP